MQRYVVLHKLGDGAFGVVFKATHTTTGDTVAIKRMKQHFNSWDECLQLREIQSLRRLQHANIIKLKEVIRENSELCMVFEYMEMNVYQIMRNRMEVMGSQPAFNEREIRSIICQTLLGLQYIHKNGFFHRDLKPENLLTKGDVVKVADFGLAKEIRSRPPFTDYVSTRWYRAPEIILRSTHYNSPIDIWALGVIMVELYMTHPLFPGSSDGDQLFKICSILGAPSPQEWDEGYQLARKMGMRFPPVSPTPLRQLIPQASPVALDLIESMLRFNPQDRPTATGCLQHAFFTGSSSIDTGYGGYNAGGGNTSLFQGIASKAPHNPFHMAAGVPTGPTGGLPKPNSGAPTPVNNSPIPGAMPHSRPLNNSGGQYSSGLGGGFPPPINPVQHSSGSGSGPQGSYPMWTPNSHSYSSGSSDLPHLRSNTPPHSTVASQNPAYGGSVDPLAAPSSTGPGWSSGHSNPYSGGAQYGGSYQSSHSNHGNFGHSHQGSQGSSVGGRYGTPSSRGDSNSSHQPYSSQPYGGSVGGATQGMGYSSQQKGKSNMASGFASYSGPSHDDTDF